MKPLAIVPARGGSKRVPGKNMRTLGGKPLVQRAIEACLDSTRLSHICVTSDSQEILDVAGRYPEVIALPRPEELSTDESLAIEYVRHSLTSVQGDFDTVVIIQPSSPLTLGEDIDATLSLLESTGADSAVSVMKLDHAVHPIKLKLLEGDRLLPFMVEENGRMASHELPELYVRNCAVYATRCTTIDRGSILGEDCRGHVMPRERSVDINDPLDLEFAQFLLQRNSREKA